jgi:hypothetical protein
MNYADAHLSDQQLLLDVEGKLSALDEKSIRCHLDACWKCPARRQEIENAIADLMRVHQRGLDASPNRVWFPLARRLDWALAAAGCGLAALSLFLVHYCLSRQAKPIPQALVVSSPDSRLTPGAATLASRQAVCAQANTKNQAVSMALQKQVFQEYGIAGAAPQAYEVDYLVTPALGRADDIRSLWPHSYSATVWNARVRDALEDRFRDIGMRGEPRFDGGAEGDREKLDCRLQEVLPHRAAAGSMTPRPASI